MTKKEEITVNKKTIQEAKRRHGNAIDSWKKNLEEAITTSYDYLKKYPKNSEKKFESVKLLLKDGLALLEDRTYNEKFSEGREIFHYMKEAISKKESKVILSNEIEKYRQDLALRGGLLIEKSHFRMDFGEKDSEILRYYDKHFGNISPSLEKSIAVVSLISIASGLLIGSPALTGNAIAQTTNASLGYGAILIIAGILGLFIAKEK